MSFFSKLFGYRWSLYIVKNEKDLAYMMHENSVIGMVGYVMSYFANGAEPVPPWSLHLNFNHKNESFELRSEHFAPDGENVTSLLIQQIEAIDPDWKVRGREPVFMEAYTKKRLKIGGDLDFSNLEATQEYLNDAFKEVDGHDELTFFSIMDQIFAEPDY